MEAVAAYGTVSSVIETAAGPQEVPGMKVTASYFRVLAVNPMIGRAFTLEENLSGDPEVLLISEQL